MAVEPLPQVTPRGPALKHELDLEHAHTLDRREVRRQNSGGQAIVRDRLERYAPMDGWRLKEYRQTKYLKHCKSWLNRITGTIEIER
jgi:hypothetical protein